MLVSRDVTLTEKRINEFPTDWSKLHVIINTKDKDVEKDLVELVEDCELEYTVTESDGTPATGKNSLLKVFLESDNDYAVGIDGDDYITDYGAQFYNNLAEHPNPPDLLALYNQLQHYPMVGHIFKIGQIPMTGHMNSSWSTLILMMMVLLKNVTNGVRET